MPAREDPPGDLQRDHRAGDPRGVRQSARHRPEPRRCPADAPDRRPPGRLHAQPAARRARSAAACRPAASSRSPSASSSSASARSTPSPPASTGRSRRSSRRRPARRSPPSSSASTARRSTSPTRRPPTRHVAAIARRRTRSSPRSATRTQKRSPAPPFTTSTLQQEASRRCASARSGRCRSPSGCTRASRRPRATSGSSPTCAPTRRPSPAWPWARRARSSASATASRTRCPRAASTRPSRRAPRRRTSRSGRRASGATRTRWPTMLKPEELRLYRLIWQRALASQMAPKELETTTIELADGPYELRASRDEGPVRRLRARLHRGPRRRRPTTTRRRARRLPALAEGDRHDRRRRHADPALHRAAAALHRGDADQGARGARDRPAVDVRGDDLDDRRPRLRPGRGAPAAPGAGRRDRDRPARRALRRLRRPRVHGADGGGARRGRPRRAGVGAAAARLLRTAARPRRREARRARARRLHDRGDRRGLLARATRWSSASGATAGSWPARCTPSTRRRGRCPARSRRPRRGPARSARSAARARSSSKRGRFGPFVGCSRYPDCEYIKKDGPPPPDPLPFEVVCPKNKDGHLVPRRARRTGNVFWGCSNYPKCDFTTNDEPLGGLHDADDGPLGAQGRGGDLPVVRLDERDRAGRHRPGRALPGRSGGSRARWHGRPARAARGGAVRRTAGGRPRTGGAPAEARPAHAAGRAGRRRVSAVAGDPATHPALERFLRSLEARDASPHTRRVVRDRGRRLPRLARRARRRLADARPAPTCAPTSPPRRRRGPVDRSRSGWRRSARSTAGPPARASRPATRGVRSPTPRLPRRLPRVLEVDQVERAARRSSTRTCDAAVTGTPERGQLAIALALRDRALVETAYAAGLRISELAAAELGALDLRRGEIRVLGKGRKERIGLLGRPAHRGARARTSRTVARCSLERRRRGDRRRCRPRSS